MVPVHTTRNEYSKHYNSQHTSWFLATAFALIALVAAAKAVHLDGLSDIKNQPKNIKWIGSAILCALGLSLFGFLTALFLRHRFTGNLLECILAFLTVGIWAAVMPAIVNPKHTVATAGEFGQIVNANLFLFPWLGLIAAVSVLVESLRTFFDRDVAKNEKSSSSFLPWGAFVASSLIVMMSASRQFEDMMCDDEDTTMCARLQYAIWLGAIGAFLAFVWMMWDLCLPTCAGLVETVLSITILTAWGFGVTFITFSNHAPAPTFSTLYFFSWASFFVAASLVASAVYRLFGDATPNNEYSEDDYAKNNNQEIDYSEEDNEERGRGAVVVDDEGIAAVPPTSVANAQAQIYK
ncbi:hypothetical protein FisN_22Lh006 [Fistulifera solaris]|uniref:Transmembrane protein n=1 Tax=Fistulifera solaris TaxID=1519565 RepID=A0A1Z5JC09_FISSO|nr:hypothetical protein FisN_22Lh006 [Fistulifera solaris]|eukprot:GAX11338.1 hypothetical protein FisN_22Lh006 [Fistulifera solaris]